MRSADPDVDDIGEGRPAHAAVLATVHALAEGPHAREHRAHRGHDILAVYDEGLRAAIAQGRVQDRPPFRDIDTLAREHTPDRMLQPRRVRQVVQQAQRLCDDPVLGVIEVEPGVLQRKSRNPHRVLIEQRAYMHVRHARLMCSKRLPGRGFRDEWFLRYGHTVLLESMWGGLAAMFAA